MPTSVRRVNKVDVNVQGNFLIFDIYGEAFLKNMIRIMVGTILKINEGRLSLEGLMDLFQRPDRQQAGITMPAKGLTMISILYNNLEFRV